MFSSGKGSEAGFVTTVSRGFTSTETGDPFFSCYRSDPDLDGTITTGRYIETLNALEGNPPPPSPEILDVGDTQVYRTDLDAGLYSYGVFYCASSKEGDWTVVPTIFLRSDGEFLRL